MSWPDNESRFFLQVFSLHQCSRVFLPWLRYASPHVTCASRELAMPQRVKQKSTAQSFFVPAFLKTACLAVIGFHKAVSHTHSLDSPVLCILPDSGKAHLQQGSTSYARSCIQNIFITCFTHMDTMLATAYKTQNLKCCSTVSRSLFLLPSQPIHERGLGASQSHRSDVFDKFSLNAVTSGMHTRAL